MARGQLSPILDPSWTRVERFGQNERPSAASIPRDAMQIDSKAEEDVDDDGWEYEETEHLVTLDLGPESKRLLQMSHQYSITGLEGPTPFLRLGNVIFKGTWDQLIGTDILLRDHKDASSSRGGGGGGTAGGTGGTSGSGSGPSSSSVSTPATQKHDLQPLPPTKTDLRTGKAPGTTRSRIQFRPAVNMVAREQALRNPAARQQSSLATPSITHKGGWIWVRGKGWIRKEHMVDIELDQSEQQQQDGDNEADRATNRSTEQSFTAPSESIASAGPKKPGRKKMSLEEKMSQSVYKSMMKMRNEGKEQANTAQASEAANRTEGAADAATDNTDTDAIMETEGV